MLSTWRMHGAKNLLKTTYFDIFPFVKEIQRKSFSQKHLRTMSIKTSSFGIECFLSSSNTISKYFSATWYLNVSWVLSSWTSYFNKSLKCLEKLSLQLVKLGISAVGLSIFHSVDIKKTPINKFNYEFIDVISSPYLSMLKYVWYYRSGIWIWIMKIKRKAQMPHSTHLQKWPLPTRKALNSL